jgi:hypothetical protein
MRVRILINDGTRTVDFFWLEHCRTDVYCGPSKIDVKHSYHASGAVHMNVAGTRRDEGQHVALKDFEGCFRLMSNQFTDIFSFMSNQPSSFDYRGGKSDAVMVIDSRTISSPRVGVSIGILEPGNFGALAPVAETDVLGAYPMQCKELLLATSVQPWVYLALHWGAAQQTVPAEVPDMPLRGTQGPG